MRVRLQTLESDPFCFFALLGLFSAFSAFKILTLVNGDGLTRRYAGWAKMTKCPPGSRTPISCIP